MIPGTLKKFSIGISLTLFLTLFPGCSKDDPVSVDPPLPLPPTLNGNWQGVFQNVLYFSLDLKEEGTRVSGSCTLTAQGMSWIGTIYGTKTFPPILLSVNVPSYQQFQISGKFVSTDEISAELINSGFNHDPLTLVRH